jgi:ketosteroid isomerase-like protein
MGTLDSNPAVADPARAYISAVGAHDIDAVEALFAEDATAIFAGQVLSRSDWINGLRRLFPALVRNDILEVLTAATHACVVYDFVTDTAAGPVRCVELMTVKDGKITEVELIFDRVAFAPVNEALEQRAAG